MAVWPLRSGTAPEMRLDPCLGLGRGQFAHIFHLGHVLQLLVPVWTDRAVVAVVGMEMWTLPDVAGNVTVQYSMSSWVRLVENRQRLSHSLSVEWQCLLSAAWCQHC